MADLHHLDLDAIEERRRLAGAYLPRAQRGDKFAGVVAGGAPGTTRSAANEPTEQGAGAGLPAMPDPSESGVAHGHVVPEPCSTGLRQHLLPVLRATVLHEGELRTVRVGPRPRASLRRCVLLGLLTLLALALGVALGGGAAHQ